MKKLTQPKIQVKFSLVLSRNCWCFMVTGHDCILTVVNGHQQAATTPVPDDNQSSTSSPQQWWWCASYTQLPTTMTMCHHLLAMTTTRPWPPAANDADDMVITSSHQHWQGHRYHPQPSLLMTATTSSPSIALQRRDWCLYHHPAQPSVLDDNNVPTALVNWRHDNRHPQTIMHWCQGLASHHYWQWHTLYLVC